MHLHVTEHFELFRNFLINFIKFRLQFGSFKIHFIIIHLSFIILRKIPEYRVHFSEFYDTFTQKHHKYFF